MGDKKQEGLSAQIATLTQQMRSVAASVEDIKRSVQPFADLDTAGYGVAFPFEQYERMAERLRSLKGRAIVSLNEHPEIRRVFDEFHIETVPIHYTVGLEAASRHEVIISSWDVGAKPAGLF
ncbi:hypothetical protein BLKGLAD_28110 [Burkholderia gladioli pv. gladioli]